MTTGDKKGIDVIVKKHPTGNATVRIAGGNVQVMNPGGSRAENQLLQAIGEIVSGLMSVDPHTQRGQQQIEMVRNSARAAVTRVGNEV